jgi:hypothetical protein
VKIIRYADRTGRIGYARQSDADVYHRIDGDVLAGTHTVTSETVESRGCWRRSSARDHRHRPQLSSARRGDDARSPSTRSCS